MATRYILTKEEPTLYKKSRPVKKFDERLHQLLDDMAETLLESGGVGLAAPQVGVLRRAVLVIETNVPEGEKEKIFDMFYSIRNTGGDTVRSTGLGLSLCRSIVEAHGGEITVRDNMPTGAVFEFTLEAVEVEIHE